MRTIRVKDPTQVDLLKKIREGKKLLTLHMAKGGKLDEFKVRVFSKEELENARCSQYKYAF